MEAREQSERDREQAQAALTQGRRFLQSSAILVWCGLAVVSGLYVTIPLTAHFARQFDVSIQTAAWSGSSFSLAYAVGLLIWGALSARFGRKPVMLSGLLALGILSPLIGLAGGLTELTALRAVQGLTAASFAPAALAYAVETYPPGKSVTVIGLITTGFLSSGMAGQVFSGAVHHQWGWPYVFYMLGGVYFLSALWLGTQLPGGIARRREDGVLTLLSRIRPLMQRAPLRRCYLITVTLLLAFVGMYTAFEELLNREPFGLDARQMLLIRAAGLPGMLLSPAAGRLAAAFGLRNVLQAGLAMAAGGLAAIGAGVSSPALALPIVIPMSTVTAAGIALAIPSLISIIGKLAGEARGAAITLYTFVLFIGATIGPQLVLAALQIGGHCAAFGVPAALMLIGWAVSFRIPAPRR